MTALPGFEPGISSFKAKDVASYTTGQCASPPGRNRTDDLWFFRPALSTKTELPGDKAERKDLNLHFMATPRYANSFVD